MSPLCCHHSRNQVAGKASLVLTICCLFLCLGGSPGPVAAADQVFTPLKSHLIDQGMPPKNVRKWLGSSRLRFEARLLAALLAKPETSLDYRQFLSKSSVARARSFKARHSQSLTRASRLTGVPPEVVVAILTVESNLGSYTGRHLTFNVLASQAVLDTKRAKDRLRRAWPIKQRKVFKTEAFKARLARRAEWARQEVLALLRLAQKAGKSPFSYRGSLAGALGMCQFVPSSLERFGSDANQDGKVELHKAHDAILSVAVYLKAHGWREPSSPRQQAEVLYKYNRSRVYGRTVLALAARLR